MRGFSGTRDKLSRVWDALARELICLLGRVVDSKDCRLVLTFSTEGEEKTFASLLLTVTRGWTPLGLIDWTPLCDRST